jgi:MFS family permease
MKKLYHLVLFTTALRVFGDAIESVAIPWTLLRGTGSLLSVAGYSLVSMLPWMLFPPLLGKVLDRVERKVKLAFLSMILQAILVVFLIFSFSNVWLAYILISLISALDTLHRYFGFTLIATITSEESELQRLNATLQGISRGFSLLAFPFAGYLAYLFGARLLFMDALFLIFGAFSLMPYLNVKVLKKEESESPAKLELTLKTVALFIGIILTFNFAISSFKIFLFSTLRNLELGEALYGTLQSIRDIGGLIALLGIVSLLKKLELKKAAFIGMLLQSLALILFGFSKVWALFFGVFVLGLGGQMLNVSMDSIFQKHFPLEKLGTYRGLFDALATIIIPLSHLTFAFLLESGFNIRMLSIMVSLLGILSSFGFWTFLKKPYKV